jgi:hypothetical protein
MSAPKRPCSATTRAGRPCRAWAVRGSDPPRCAAHGRTAASSQAAYELALCPDELAYPTLNGEIAYPALNDELTCPALNGEIAIARDMLRRLVEALRDGTPSGELVQLAQTCFAGTRTVAGLLRDKRALSGGAADGLMGAIGQALDELSTEWGVDL